jgi:hypothetical protein
MRRCHPNLAGFILMFMLLTGSLSAFAADSQTPSFSGAVSIETASMGLTIGAEWGKGILTLIDSKQYRFTIKGIEIGTVGAGTALLHGRVYNLTKVEDFAGLYGAVEVGFTIIGGSGGVAMRNEHGVVIYLESIEQGVEVRLGAAGVEIKLQE